MAAVWGMEKFHYYLYQSRFTLLTDQKPIVSNFKKHLIDVSPRIQRIAIRAQQYDFDVKWIAGKTNVISDSLSRVTPMEISHQKDLPLPVLAVNWINQVNDVNREEQLQSVREATQEEL